MTNVKHYWPKGREARAVALIITIMWLVYVYFFPEGGAGIFLMVFVTVMNCVKRF
jgi:hypothetical protein